MKTKPCQDIQCEMCIASPSVYWKSLECTWWDSIRAKYVFHDTPVIADDIKKPAHYIFSKPANDVLDVLAECGFNMPDHYIASAIAYLCRCKKKNQYRKDLEKAAFYINKAIELHDAEERSNSKNK